MKPELKGGDRGGFLSWFSHNYTAQPAPRVSFEDSPRIDKLMRSGNIYLSLRDAVRTLHGAGFRVRLLSAATSGTAPAAGTIAASGTIVELARPLE